jgi:guanylate kinase
MDREGPQYPGLLVVISGPSGVGKDTLIRELFQVSPSLTRVTTITSRPPAEGEQQGVDYQFVSRQEFERLRDQGYLLEWAEVYGNYYGTPREETLSRLQRGETVVLKIDVQGSLTIKRLLSEAVLIFIDAPSKEELERRVRQRNRDEEEMIQRRLAEYDREKARWRDFDYYVLNDSLVKAVKRVMAIIEAEKLRTFRM